MTTHTEQQAHELDSTDPMAAQREEFHIPPADGGGYAETAYFAGNSLGLQPRRLAARLAEELSTGRASGSRGTARPNGPG